MRLRLIVCLITMKGTITTGSRFLIRFFVTVIFTSRMRLGQQIMPLRLPVLMDYETRKPEVPDEVVAPYGADKIKS